MLYYNRRNLFEMNVKKDNGYWLKLNEYKHVNS